MENLAGVLMLLAVLALFPSAKLVAELVNFIGRKLTRKVEPKARLTDHMQEQL